MSVYFHRAGWPHGRLVTIAADGAQVGVWAAPSDPRARAAAQVDSAVALLQWLADARALVI